MKLTCFVIFFFSSYFTGKDSGGECNVPYIMRNPMPREKPDMPWLAN